MIRSLKAPRSRTRARGTLNFTNPGLSHPCDALLGDALPSSYNRRVEDRVGDEVWRERRP